jgi:GNAT superfamily N-acetyltransferase
MPVFDTVLTDAPNDADQLAIEGGLADFNAKQAGYRDWRELAVLARDPAAGQTIGGILGRTSLGSLFVDLVYLPEALRGQAIGSRMMALVEREAARRGCRSGALITITFQAPGFCERHGWRKFGRVPCDPSGTFRVFMTKTLAVADNQSKPPCRGTSRLSCG